MSGDGRVWAPTVLQPTCAAIMAAAAVGASRAAAPARAATCAVAPLWMARSLPLVTERMDS